MERLPYVKIQTECPITKLGLVSIKIYYAINKYGVAVGRAERCCDSKDGNVTCHKCIAYFTQYVSFNPLPQDGDFIPADLAHFPSEKANHQEFVQEQPK